MRGISFARRSHYTPQGEWRKAGHVAVRRERGVRSVAGGQGLTYRWRERERRSFGQVNRSRKVTRRVTLRSQLV